MADRCENFAGEEQKECAQQGCEQCSLAESLKNQAELDQGIAQAAEILPRLCHGIYIQLQAQGFEEYQAFRLTRDYLISMNTNREK